MPLDPNMIFPTFRVLGDSNVAVGKRRAVLGTGFLISIPSLADPAVRYAYALTCHHVIDGEIRTAMQAANPFGGGELYEPVEITDWYQPIKELDLALAPVNFLTADTRTFSQLEADRHFLPYGAGMHLGAPIYYIGVLEPLNRVMARQGIIGALDQVGMHHRGGYTYTAHLVDCRSYGGFSGSPCYVGLRFAGLTPIKPNISLPPDWLPEPIGHVLSFVKLCGMFTQHLDTPREGDVVSRYGVGVMLRSDDIWRALMTEKMQDQRAEWDAQNAAANPDEPTLKNVAAGEEADDEYARFEALAHQLVNTPKPTPENGTP